MDNELKELVYNLMCDLKKKEIEPAAKARLIQQYIASENLSQRQLARQLGIPHNTLQDWLLWGKLSDKDIDGYIGQGYTKSDIYRSLRGGTLSGKAKELDVALETCINKLRVFKLMPPYSTKSAKLIDELRKILDIIEKQVK